MVLRYCLCWDICFADSSWNLGGICHWELGPILPSLFIICSSDALVSQPAGLCGKEVPGRASLGWLRPWGVLTCPWLCTWHPHAGWFRTRHLLSLPPFPSSEIVNGGAYFTNCMELYSCQALFKQQMTSISCFVQAQHLERKRLFQSLWHWGHYVSPSILNI